MASPLSRRLPGRVCACLFLLTLVGHAQLAPKAGTGRVTHFPKESEQPGRHLDPTLAETRPESAAAADRAAEQRVEVGLETRVDPGPATTSAAGGPVPSAPSFVREPTRERDAQKTVLLRRLGVGGAGWLQMGMLMQGWIIGEHGVAIAENPAGGSYDTTVQVRLRRAQVRLWGDIVDETFAYLLVFDLAKPLQSQPPDGAAPGEYRPADTTPLLEYALTFKSMAANVSVGQWKSPISYEGYTTSAELLLPERAYSTRYFGDNYDIGLKIEKRFEYMKYSLQVLQGMPTPNHRDTNLQKELALRIEITPVRGIMFGGAGLTSMGERESQASTRDVLEADLALEAFDFVARGELIWGWSGIERSGVERVKARGMMGALGYTIAHKVQPVVRLSHLDVDVTTSGNPVEQPLYARFGLATDEVQGTELGINYFIDEHFAKVQAAYGYFEMDGIARAQHGILSAQVAF